jgi:septal ring factor EnvC (AmiA/AmiB activator)
MCLALILVAGSCTNPRVQANIAQALNDVGNELTAQRQDMSALQEEIDSLKQAMAHQDTIIKRLINVTGIPPSGASSFQPSGPFGQR